MIDFPPWLLFIAAALASWRVAVMLVFETGPFEVFARLRIKVGITHYDDGTVESAPDSGMGKLLSCVWCLSFWTTLPACAILWSVPEIVVVLGIWGAATYLESWRTK